MRTILRRLLIDRRGATAVEYGLIVSLIVIAMVASLQAVASQTIGMWNSVSSRVTQASNH
ncbi:MAG: Flp family type IVb pilin [Sphingomonas sp.]|uniref:Flp family type IVb pilin n=1 Tax=Sphingomonas sp. TaxID=28214 RepID=UPI0025DF7F4F|nr:Flp family type IVb pilin [Sphingomonas sp.]MBX9882436.1 Flp family type IVb pilin [Sphingomonas sp.]